MFIPHQIITPYLEVVRWLKDINYYTNNCNGIPKGEIQIESISNERTKEHTGGAIRETWTVGILKIKKSGIKKVVQHLGNTYGGRTEFTKPSVTGFRGGFLENKVKGNQNTGNVDRINILPIFEANFTGKDVLPKLSSDGVKDFIKFMFKDIVNNKYLVFRAILESITDTITLNLQIRFIGRLSFKVYTYMAEQIEV